MDKNQSIIIEDRIFKKEYKDSGNKPLMILNITLPKISQKGSLGENSEKLYSGMEAAFTLFCEGKLLKRADKNKNSDGFKPYAGVMKYRCPYENSSVLSVFTDAFVFDRFGKSKTVRLSQVWHKEEGRILGFYDFFTRKDKETILNAIVAEAEKKQKNGLTEYKNDFQSRVKSNICFENFYIVKEGFCFFFPASTLSDTKAPEVFTFKQYNNL